MVAWKRNVKHCHHELVGTENFMLRDNDLAINYIAPIPNLERWYLLGHYHINTLDAQKERR